MGPLEHVRVPLEAVVQGMVDHGLPRPLAEVFASIDGAVARGELAAVSDSVERLTGRAPQSLREFLLTHRAAIAAAANTGR